MDWFTASLISPFLLPPLNLILLGTIGVLLLGRCPRMGSFLVMSALVLLYLLSTPYVAETALQKLEKPPAPHSFDTVQAIVILASGTYFNAPEYGGDTVNRLGLERIRYAARLHRLTNKPMLATGGSPLGGNSSEAAQMKAALEKEFQVPVKWVEEDSRNTRENAYKSFAMLKKNGVSRIALVTHAWHMPRASREFERAGFKVIPAATAYTTRYKTDVYAFIPTADALQKSNWFLHEIIGILWYRLMPAPDPP